jgi:hypothetical protein
MKLRGCLLLVLLTATEIAFSQTRGDSTFSVFFNAGVGFSHAQDPHINRWLTKYGYRPEPHVPESINFELSAMPVSSRFMYSLKLSTMVSASNLTTFNILGGVYYAIVKTKKFLLLGGLGLGYHNAIITLNGNLPPAYDSLAIQYRKQLSLRRDGLFVEPLLRVFWFPISYRNLQVGLFGSFGADMALNSRWKLGYYDANHGKFNHFKSLEKPSDQWKVFEYGWSYKFGLSVRLHLL